MIVVVEERTWFRNWTSGCVLHLDSVVEELVDDCWPWSVVTWWSKILMSVNFFFLLSIFNLFGRIELCAKMSIS